MLIEEYDLTRDSTLIPIREDELSRDEIKWFRAELKAIAGENPHGGQNLELRWAGDYHDPMSTSDQLKYLDFVHSGVELGERRFIVEIWRSPQFLENSGRYQLASIQDTDGTKLLKTIQSQGCYDYWLRLERANLTFHPLDKEAVAVCRALWQYEQMSQFQRDVLEQADAEQERRMFIARQRMEQRQNYFGIIPAHAVPQHLT